MKRIFSMVGVLLLVCAGINLSYAADYYVMQTENAADTNDGSKTSPWQTVDHAAKTAQAGDTVHIGKGVYRGGLKIMNSGSKGKPITFKALGDGRVLISGADVVSGFAQEGKLWVKRPWKKKFKWYWGKESSYPEVANDNSPFKSAGRMENVFLDGTPLQWVPRKEDLAPGRFYWNGKPDSEDGELLIYPPEGMDLSKVQIEIPVRGAVLSGPWGTYPRGLSEVRWKKQEDQYKDRNADWIVLDGLDFGYTCEGYVSAGAMITGDNWTVKNCTFEYMNAGGLWIGGDDARLEKCVARYNGKMGYSGKYRVYGAVLEDCVSIHNNRKFYKIYWDAGGLKLHHARNTVIRNFITAFNFGSSLWYDIDCIGNTVEDSISFGNNGLGFFYEVSDKGVFKNNVSFGNGCGFMYAHSSNGLIEDNVVIGCSSGYILGGDREQFKGVNTTFKNNIILENYGKNVGWKWSKNPDGRSNSSKNIITGNLFATESGSNTFELYKILPSLKEFEAGYKNGYGNKQVSGLGNIDPASRKRIDWAMEKLLKSLSVVEPKFTHTYKGAHLKEIWRLGSAGKVGGYWVTTSDGPVLVLVVRGREAFSLVSGGAKDVTLWEFPHLGPHRINKVQAHGNLLSFEPTPKFAVVTGLAEGTAPLGELMVLKAERNGKEVSEIVEGEKAQIRLSIKNPFEVAAEFTVKGDGLAAKTVKLDAGKSETLMVDVSPVGGTTSQKYALMSPLLGAPYELEVPLRVARKAAAAKAGSEKLNIVVDSEDQRDPRVWDEVTGKRWEGAKDVSAKAAVSYTGKALKVKVNVVDDKLYPGENSDSVTVFLDTRTGSKLRSSKNGSGVYRINVPAPDKAEWTDLVADYKAPLVSNGNFKSGKNGWYVPKNSNVSIITDQAGNFAHITGKSVIQRDIKIKPEWKKLVLTARARFNDIKPGSKSWHCGRVVVEFKNDKGKHVGGWPDMMSFKGSQKDWKKYTRTYEIPEGATKFRLQAGMWEVAGGELDVTDITVVPVAGESNNEASGDEITAKGRTTGSGYEVELKVPAAFFADKKLSAGKTIGFDLSVGDADREKSQAPGTRLYWNGSDGRGVNDPGAFGVLVLE